MKSEVYFDTQFDEKKEGNVFLVSFTEENP